MDALNYMQPSYDEKEIDAVSAYMRSGAWLTEFKKTREFEESIRCFTNAAHCSVMMNGTVTLLAALMACGIGVGDEVIVPDFTMSATSHAVAMLGAKPVFVDIEKETLCMDFEAMKQAITPNTKAVIFVDLNGRYSMRFSELADYCRANKLHLIEDAAQALGSTYHGRALGTFGDIGSYSFSMPKIITTGQGGAIVTDNDDLFEKILKIRDFGRAETGSDHYVMVGGNFKFTDVQAVIGIEQMKKMPWRVERKKQMGKLYEQLLQGISQVAVVHNNFEDTAPCFIELLCKERKQELVAFLKERNIQTRNFYPPLHSEPAYGLTGAHFPVAEEVSRQGLWLPSFVELTDEQIKYICSCVKEFYEVR